MQKWGKPGGIGVVADNGDEGSCLVKDVDEFRVRTKGSLSLTQCFQRVFLINLQC